MNSSLKEQGFQEVFLTWITSSVSIAFWGERNITISMVDL